MAADLVPISRGPSILLGVGLGGFADGIILHQIAQWHNMGSSVLPPATMDAMQQNMRWDGFFHLAMLIATLAGVYWLASEARQGKSLPDIRTLTGLLLLGWGGFNLVEGLIDHHLLDLHHVRDLPGTRPPLRLDLPRLWRSGVPRRRSCPVPRAPAGLGLRRTAHP